MNAVKELIQTLVQEVHETEERRRWQIQKEREEAERRERLRLAEEAEIKSRILMEERAQREFEEVVRGSIQRLEESKEESKQRKREEYQMYYEKYHDLKKFEEEMRNKSLKMGLSPFVADAMINKSIEIQKEDWPEPYRSKCRYTFGERWAFLIDPDQATMWVNVLPC